MNGNDDANADALWRAITYISVAQLHLAQAPTIGESLTPERVKERPAGHWGTVPGAVWALVHTLLSGPTKPARSRLVPLLGAGHAGIAQLALAWLTGDLAKIRPQFTPDTRGLSALVEAFPEMDGLGSEVCPQLPAGGYLGGWLGGAIAFAHGMALNTQGQIVVPIIGDGECETPTTAAALLTSRELWAGTVLPIIQVNGFRMGGRSLLGAMNDKELSEYGVGSGWNAHITRVTGSGVDEHAQFQSVLNAATAATIGGVPTLLFLRCEKGFGGPAVVSGRRMFGTPSMHKTPLMQCRSDAGQRALLDEWLASYRPAELFDHNWQPAGRLAEALRVLSERPKRPTPPTPAVTPTSTQRHDGFAGAVSSAVRHHAKGGDFRVFSPDELTSNRLGDLVGEPWVHEVLAEEVLLGWLAGWVNTGGRGVLVSYEAFAPLLTTGLIAHLKHRRLAAQTELWPSLNILLTSYGWHNTYTHGDPSLVTSLLAAGDPAVRVFTPADPARLASTLDEAFGSYDQVNVIVAGKHSTAPFPPETVHEELSRGLAIWPRLSDNAEPDLTVVTIGDLPAGIAAEAVPLIRTHHGRNVRVVHVQDMTVLGERSSWPHGLTDSEFAHYFGAHAALLIVTLGHPAAVWGLLAGRSSRPVQVIGWREPPGPLPQHKLAADAGLDADGLCRAAARLLDRQAVSS